MTYLKYKPFANFVFLLPFTEHQYYEELPEENKGLFAFAIQDIPSVTDKDQMMHGYCIMVRIDFRYQLENGNTVDHFEAWVVGKNCVLIKVPAWPYAFWGNEDIEQLQKDGAPSHIIAGLKHARKKFEKERNDRFYKHILLEFGPEVKLSASAINVDAGPKEALYWEFYPVRYTVNNSLGRAATNSEHWVGFEVARTDLNPVLTGDINTAPTQSKAAGKVAKKSMF
jgi:hypothetical protein